MNNIWDEFGRYVFNVEVEVEGDGRGQQAQQGWALTGSATSSTGGSYSYAGGHAAAGRDAIAAAAGAAIPSEIAEADYAAELEAPVQVETRRVDEREKLGRNDPCWCGSGKKFKKCHGA
jgi:preprotein translocase subunit SecA